MKSSLIVTLMAACVLTTAVSRADEPHRRALLVAVNGYNHGMANDVADLHTSRDVEAIKSILISKWGFKDGLDIKVLETSKDTTHQKIMDWFRDFLVLPSKPGDIIYFHFSGHGRTVEDLSRDTHVDQGLMASDYIPNDTKNDIHGRDITKLLVELQKPEHHPASITLSFDSCYSGTITRGPTDPRDRGIVGPGPTPTPKWDTSKLAGGLFDPGQAEQKDYVVISACRADEEDTEIDAGQGIHIGPLSYALSIALGEATDTTTYHQVIENVGSIMRGQGLRQEPQVEGDWEKTLFKGIRAKSSTVLTTDFDRDKQQAVLLAGFPMGVTEKSKYNLFRKGDDPKTAIPIGTAVVSHVDATYSDLECSLIDNIGLPDVSGATAVITQRSYTPAKTKVDLSAIALHPQFKDIQSALDDVSAFADLKSAVTGYEKDYSLRVLPASSAALQSDQMKQTVGNDVSPDSIVVQRVGGSLLGFRVKDTDVAVLPNDDALPSRVATAVSHYVSWRTVNELCNQDGTEVPDIEVKYVPCTINETTGKVTGDLPPVYSPGHQLEMKVGSHFYCMVRNTGHRDAYVSILDLTSEGTVYALWPRAGVATSNIVKADGVWHKTRQFDDDHSSVPLPMGTPLGQDSVRIIATIKPSNFSFLDNRWRDKTEAEKDSLSGMINNVTVGHSEHFGPSDDGWRVFGFTYTIVDK